MTPPKKTGKSRENNQDDAARPSRSAKKRESAALQKLGEELTRFSPQERETLGLSPELLEALSLHDKITDREGARRQRQFIGKLMRMEDADRISRELALRQNMHGDQIALFHNTELWRDKLLAADEEERERLLQKLQRSHPDIDYKALENIRILARQATGSPNSPDAAAAARNIFRELAKIL